MAPEWAVGESKTYQQKLLVPGTNKRKLFGILEKPNLPPSAPSVTYKIFMFGKASSGKTWTMNRLSGQELPCQHIETVGIQCSNVYWPMKIGNRLILFRLEIWDAGDSSVKRYNHVLPACREGVDAVLLCFSTTERESWIELPRLLSTATQPTDRAAVIAVATRYDQFSHREVTEAEMESFEATHGIPILKLGNTADDYSDELTHTAPILNFLCKRLWQRDQELLSIKQ
ncbi:ciliogenesis and planar polarity effector 2-like [Homarus americanus]|nr:ciliogenesis and planar polarity effector 2-like [Homarus americanus]XP_042234074.1 ciliogenesis and planar polarity effector 2-like [Homarus americanus]XP_042234076.1 ciliogenesis and planar polarity effector 2-like [Homarus americanus]XP_042234077.1 ciliogenesis and planar polarity effector 2-like [Homarus americanus]XP_042234078.1 ciliogenesis and planar polarity effector 2-like [Homarus americanus]XP_042234079.1 ciliogenesis and planar polarity effector 2-like [Homarus americanus]